MALSEPRLLGERHKVNFAGFWSDTWTLQQEGWQISAEQDFMSNTIRIALCYPPSGLYMLADEQRYQFRDVGQGSRPRSLEFMVRKCSSRMEVRLLERSFGFKPIDALPQFTDAPYRSIQDFGIFSSCLARTEEIIVEPQSVAECLDLIRKMQAPELAAARKRNVQRDFMSPTNQQQFHAQILSIAA